MAEQDDSVAPSLRDKLLSFRGRLRRRDWWLLGFALSFSQLICSYVAVRFVGADLYVATAAAPFSPPWVVMIVVGLVFLWPQCAIAAKRAQDRNVNGLWSGLLVAGLFIFDRFVSPGGSSGENAVWLVSLAVTFVLIVWLGFLRGTRGPNRFGPSTKAGERQLDVFS